MTRIISLLFVVFLAVQTAYGDEIETAIKEAGTAYEKGNYQLSLERLEQAMNLVKDVQAAKIIQYFPKPLDGWRIADSEKDSASPIPNVQLGLFSSVIRRYKKQPENGVGINLLAGKDDNNKDKKIPWVQFTLLQQPNSLIKMGFQGAHALRASTPEAKSVSVDGYSGILYCNPKKPTCDGYFDLDGKFMIMINAENASLEEVEKYAKSFDIDGLISAN